MPQHRPAERFGRRAPRILLSCYCATLLPAVRPQRSHRLGDQGGGSE